MGRNWCQFIPRCWMLSRGKNDMMKKSGEKSPDLTDVFPDILRGIRQERQLSQVEFAKALGISQGYLSDLERGRKTPSDTLLIALTSRCGPLPGVEIPGGMPTAESNTLPLLQQIETQPTRGAVPGKPVDQVRLPGMAGAQFAMIADGNFMAPTILEGDLVLLAADAEPAPGDIVLLNNQWGEAILRRYRERDGAVLFSPDNSSYRSFAPDPNTRVVARVVAVWRRM